MLKREPREPLPRKETTSMILERALALCPDLIPPEKRQSLGSQGLEIIQEGCGLRPTRKGGVRIEVEKIGPLNPPRSQNSWWRC